MQDCDNLYTMDADALKNRLEYLEARNVYDRSKFEILLVRAYRLGKQEEQTHGSDSTQPLPSSQPTETPC